MELHLKISGALMVLLAAMHAFFPRYFKWGKELRPLSLISRQMMLVHTFFVALVVMLIGILCIMDAGSLVNTSFGRRVSLGIGIFWGFRLLVQFFVYSTTLWKNKRFETGVHILFSGLWTYFSAVFILTGTGLG